MFNTHTINETYDSLYAKYIKEREGKEIVYHIEGCKPVGFATYKEVNLDSLSGFYIVDIYVDPEFRKRDVASKMANTIAARAKAAGRPWLFGSVDVNCNGTEASVQTLLQYGFKIRKTNGSMIYFEKYLGDS